jgi:hypothetical protein
MQPAYALIRHCEARKADAIQGPKAWLWIASSAHPRFRGDKPPRNDAERFVS